MGTVPPSFQDKGPHPQASDPRAASLIRTGCPGAPLGVSVGRAGEAGAAESRAADLHSLPECPQILFSLSLPFFLTPSPPLLTFPFP